MHDIIYLFQILLAMNTMNGWSIISNCVIYFEKKEKISIGDQRVFRYLK